MFKYFNIIKKYEFFLLLIVFFIFLISGSRNSLIPTGDEIHRIILSHSLAYDGDFDMNNDYNSKKFFKWACCDRHILAQEYFNPFSFVYDTSNDLDEGQWISKSNYKNFPKVAKIDVPNASTINIYDVKNNSLYMSFEPDATGINIIRNLGFPGRKLKTAIMENGQLAVVFDNPLYPDITVINFKTDKGHFWTNRHLPGERMPYMFYNGSIADRNKKLDHTNYDFNYETMNFDDGLNSLEKDFLDTKEIKQKIIEKNRIISDSKVQVLSHSIGPSLALLPVSLLSKYFNYDVNKYIHIIKVYMNLLWSFTILIIFNITIKLGCSKKNSFYLCILISILYPTTVYASSANSDSFGFILVTLLLNGFYYIDSKKNSISYFFYIFSICLLPWFHFKYVLISILGICIIIFKELSKKNMYKISTIFYNYKFSILSVLISFICFEYYENFKISDGRIPPSGIDLITIDLVNFFHQNLRLFLDPFEGILIPFTLSIFGFAGLFIMLKKYFLFSFFLLLIFSTNMFSYGLAPEDNYFGLYFGTRYNIAFLAIIIIGIIYYINTEIIPSIKNILEREYGFLDLYYTLTFVIFLSINFIPTYWAYVNASILSSFRLFGPKLSNIIPFIAGYHRTEINFVTYSYGLMFLILFITLIYRNLISTIKLK